MKITGIICEYDPFHNGHEYLLQRAKESGDAVVCVMSGNITQRGGFAMVDKYTRAEMALRCGADLVLELPYPYCSASAEYFATVGVAILASIGAEHICFGSECGNAEKLMRAAHVAKVEPFDLSKDTAGTAEGYFEILRSAYLKEYGEDLPLGPNDILGVEYCKAIFRGGYDISPIAVTRVGDGFRADTVGEHPFASATALRAHIRKKGMDELERYMPQTAVRLMEEAIAAGEAPVEAVRIERSLLSFFRLADPEILRDIAELGNGLEYRLCEVARDATSLEEFFRLAATKKYTDARIRRATLYAMTGVRREHLRTLPRYTTVLGANAVGCHVLSDLRKTEGKIAIVTKPADGKTVDAVQYHLSLAADSLFTLAMPKPQPAGAFIKRSAVIL